MAQHENETLAQFLERRRIELSREEGYPGGNLIPWVELAQRAGIPNNNLARWKDGISRPSTFDYVYALADVFGPEVFDKLGIDIDPDLAWLFVHRNDPNVAKVIEEAKAKGESNQRAGNRNPDMFATS